MQAGDYEKARVVIERMLATVEGAEGSAEGAGDSAGSTMIQLAWLWLGHQPTSALTRWFRARVEQNGGRLRKTAIVALARKLLKQRFQSIAGGEDRGRLRMGLEWTLKRPADPRACTFAFQSLIFSPTLRLQFAAAFKLVATLFTAQSVDKFGRKPLLFAGTTVMAEMLRAEAVAARPLRAEP